MPTPEQSFNAYQGATRKAEKRATARAKGQKPNKGKGGHDWGDGKQHSISLSQHKKNVKTKRAAKLNDPAKFVAPRGATDVNRDATASANLRYGEVERNQALQGKQIPVYYQNYLQQVGGIKAGVEQGYQKAIADVTARQQATAASDTTARDSLGSQMQADAKSRGATVDPSLLANDVNAANVRNTNQSAFADLLGAQQQAQGTYFAGQQQAGAASQLQQQGRLATDVRGTAADKGAYKSTYVTDAREKERTNLLQRAAFEIPSANTALTQKTSTANSKRTAKNAAKTRQAAARKERNTPITSGPFAGLTHAQVRHLSPEDKARRTAKAAKPKAGAKPKATTNKPLSEAGLKAKSMIRTGAHRVRAQDVNRPGYWNKSYDTLVEVDGLDPVVARAIIQGARHGKLGPKTAKSLKDDYGIDGLAFPKPKRRKGANSGSGGGPHGTNRP